MIAVPRPQPQARAVPLPPAALLQMSRWHLQTFTPPDPLDPLLVDQPACRLQQGTDLPIATTTRPFGQGPEIGGECRFVVSALRHLAPCRAMLAGRTTPRR